MLRRQPVHIQVDRHDIRPTLVTDQVANVQAALFVKLVKLAEKLEVNRLYVRARIESAARYLDLAIRRVFVSDQLDFGAHLFAGDLRAGQQLQLRYRLAQPGVIEYVGATDADNTSE